MKINEDINIVIGGDLYPQGFVEPLFIEGDSKAIFSDILPYFKQADYTVVNLECPLTNTDSPIEKDGAALRAAEQTINGIKASHIDAVNLSNNHILDHGDKGVKSTLRVLSENKVNYFGAGANINAAKKFHIVEIKGKKIAFMGVAEHEFSIATDNSYGANPLHVTDNIREIKKLRKSVDFIIVLYHGGKEHYEYPTPKQQDISRFFIEEGADAVIAQHSHIAGSFETYLGKPIIYGQGNLLFEKLVRNNKTWFTGFLVSLKLKENAINFEFIPYEQSNSFVGVRRLNEKDSDQMKKELNKRSLKIESTDFVKEEWLKLCLAEIPLYNSRLLGHNRLFRVINRKINFTSWAFPKWKKVMIRNVVECETHREGLETLWNDKNSKF